MSTRPGTFLSSPRERRCPSLDVRSAAQLRRWLARIEGRPHGKVVKLQKPTNSISKVSQVALHCGMTKFPADHAILSRRFELG
jgi:hypothetical protein